MFNRIANCHNRFQGSFKKVLCVCSAGLLRSPTAAFVLSKFPFNFNTRAAGMTEEYALIPVDEVLLEWAEEIVCMEKDHELDLKLRTKKPIICLEIKDTYAFRDPKLIKEIKSKYIELTNFREANND